MPGASLACRARFPIAQATAAIRRLLFPRAAGSAGDDRRAGRWRIDPGNPEADQAAWNRSIATCCRENAGGHCATQCANAPTCCEKLADLTTTPEDKSTWVRQLADTVSATVQAGGIPMASQRLEALFQRLQSEKAAPDLVAYVKFRFLSADYGTADAAAGRFGLRGQSSRNG